MEISQFICGLERHRKRRVECAGQATRVVASGYQQFNAGNGSANECTAIRQHVALELASEKNCVFHVMRVNWQPRTGSIRTERMIVHACAA